MARQPRSSSSYAFASVNRIAKRVAPGMCSYPSGSFADCVGSLSQFPSHLANSLVRDLQHRAQHCAYPWPLWIASWSVTLTTSTLQERPAKVSNPIKLASCSLYGLAFRCGESYDFAIEHALKGPQVVVLGLGCVDCYSYALGSCVLAHYVPGRGCKYQHVGIIVCTWTFLLNSRDISLGIWAALIRCVACTLVVLGAARSAVAKHRKGELLVLSALKLPNRKQRRRGANVKEH
eukprot:4311786-Amphidinium_carterae.1